MGAARGCFVNFTKLTRGTVLRFFSGKMNQGMVVFWSKTEILGQFCDFFFKQLAQLGDNWYNFLLVSWNHGITGISGIGGIVRNY